MNATDLAHYNAALDALEADLDAEDILGADAQQTVALDQQSVGRLSRMDALQGQAMAKATAARRNALRARIEATRTRMAEEEFGYCVDCGEEIAAKRLDLDPTVPTCISCARG